MKIKTCEATINFGTKDRIEEDITCGSTSDVRKVKLTREFDGEYCYWCDDCRLENSYMISVVK